MLLGTSSFPQKTIIVVFSVDSIINFLNVIPTMVSHNAMIILWIY
jgi:hypothetical protein